MTVATFSRRTRAGDEAAATDAWPHTTRILPWLLVAFLVVLWLVPFQSVTVPVQLPVDAKLDRFLLAGIIIVWLVALLAGGAAAPRLRRSPINAAVGMFVLAAFLSIVLNLRMLAWVDDLSLAWKKLALLLSYVSFYVVVSSTFRRIEAIRLSILMVALGCITAIGGIWQYRTGANLFYSETRKFLLPGFSLTDLGTTQVDETHRPVIQGPTQHPLALATMLALALPFATVYLVHARSLKMRLTYAMATALILTAQFSTVRKSALVVPFAVLVVLLPYLRTSLIKLAPLAVVFLLVTHVVAPGAMATIRYAINPSHLSSSASTQGRTQDYSAVTPDVLSHPAIGRGYGTYDSHKYRLLDNQYLLSLIETGISGVALYLFVMLSVLYVCQRVIRSRDPALSPIAIGIAGATGAVLASSALYDALSFPQVPYLFFFLAGLAVVIASPEPPPRPTLVD